VDYTQDLAHSANAAEVHALYDAAGLNLRTDLKTLNGAPRISADPSAVAYMEQNIVFNGQLTMPVLTMHTTGDGLPGTARFQRAPGARGGGSCSRSRRAGRRS
jgi:hypothetical protein